MQNIPEKLRAAHDEVHKAARNQDLTEVPKRAKLDHDADGFALVRPGAPSVMQVLKVNL